MSGLALTFFVKRLKHCLIDIEEVQTGSQIRNDTIRDIEFYQFDNDRDEMYNDPEFEKEMNEYFEQQIEQEKEQEQEKKQRWNEMLEKGKLVIPENFKPRKEEVTNESIKYGSETAKQLEECRKQFFGFFEDDYNYFFENASHEDFDEFVSTVNKYGSIYDC